MKIEDILKSTVPMDNSKKIIMNIMYTQNIFDISSEQFNVLRILRGQKGKPTNMFVIQERMLAKTSNTTRLVDKLLLKELVTREVCPANRRKIEVTITQKGLDLLIELEPKVKIHEESYSQKLSEEERLQLNELLEKFRNQ